MSGPSLSDFYTNRHAFIIGIDYDHGRFMPLGEAENDANRMAEVLSGPYYQFDITSLIGSKATRRAISVTLNKLSEATNPDDLLLVYYAGHGTPFRDQARIIPYDADPDEYLPGFSIDEFTALCQVDRGPRHIGFIFDACFSARSMGIVEGEHRALVSQNALLKHRAFMTLAASAGLADDLKSMTHYVVQELRAGEVDPETGLFTFSDLALRVRNAMIADMGIKQTPVVGHLPFSEGSELILGVAGRPHLPARLLQNLRSSNAHYRKGAVLELINIAKLHEDLTPLAIEQLKLARDNILDPELQAIIDEYLSTEPTEEIEILEADIAAAHRQKPATIAKAAEQKQTIPTVLKITDKLGQTKHFELTRPITKLGRHQQDNDIVLSSHVISRHHAQFEVSEGRVFITDLGSSNGTFVNGPRLPPNQRYPLNEGDEILVGGVRIVISSPQPLLPEIAILSDAIQDTIGSPFEWCEIPGVQGFSLNTYEGNKGIYDISPFLIAKYLITYEQFQVFIDADDGYYDITWWQDLAVWHEKPGDQYWKIPNHPRENVSWYDAVAFCRWLSNRMGYEIRLPTEWEWQWAAQGPDARVLPWGDDYNREHANIDEKYSGYSGGKNLARTTPVGSYPMGASPYGVLDMSGNVWEWCLNHYDDPVCITLTGNEHRVLRGGSFGSHVNDAKNIKRSWYAPHLRGRSRGFRVAGFGPFP